MFVRYRRGSNQWKRKYKSCRRQEKNDEARWSQEDPGQR